MDANGKLPGSPWNNIVLYMAGLRRDTVTGPLVEKILARIQRGASPVKRWSAKKREMALLAIVIAARRSGVSSLLRRQVQEICYPCLPPQTPEEADLFAQLGEAALPLLPATPPDDAAQAAACARCLRLIGTAAAKQRLSEQYASIHWPDVAFEVVQSLPPADCSGFWQWVSRRNFIFGGEILHPVASRIGALYSSPHLKEITHLNLSNLTHLSDIRVIAEYPNIISIDLGNTAVSDVSALAALTNLTYLSLDNTAVSDVSALPALTNLDLLSLDNTAVSDVSALAALTNLTYLSLNNTAVSDVSALAALTNLTRLSLDNTAVSDVSALAALTNLTRLSLDNTAVSNVSVLRKYGKIFIVEN